MKRQPGGIATGLVVALLGLWLVLRTVTHDDEGKNLPDRILGLDGDGADSSDDDSADTPVDPAAISAATSAVGAAGAKGAKGAADGASTAVQNPHPPRRRDHKRPSAARAA